MSAASGWIEWGIFGALALIAVVSAASMIVTMSMYRAGLALMSSFVALAGIFVLLNADMLAAIQIMMNVGGMLIMILFMVMLMMDPGGEMMWDMKRSMRMRGLGALSMRPPKGPLPAEDPPTHHDSHATHEAAREAHHEMNPQAPTMYTCPMHPEVRQPTPGQCPKCGMTLVPATDTTKPATHDPDAMAGGHSGQASQAEHAERSGHAHAEMSGMDMGGMNMGGSDAEAQHSGHDAHGALSPRQNYQMMVDMAMSTAQAPLALALGALVAALLIVIVILTPWTLSSQTPTGDASAPVGLLLLGRYMIGFEGAAFLIVAGIAAAVIFARREGATPGHAAQEEPAAQHGAHAPSYGRSITTQADQAGERTSPQSMAGASQHDEARTSQRAHSEGAHEDERHEG